MAKAEQQPVLWLPAPFGAMGAKIHTDEAAALATLDAALRADEISAGEWLSRRCALQWDATMELARLDNQYAAFYHIR